MFVERKSVSCSPLGWIPLSWDTRPRTQSHSTNIVVYQPSRSGKPLRLSPSLIFLVHQSLARPSCCSDSLVAGNILAARKVYPSPALTHCIKTTEDEFYRASSDKLYFSSFEAFLDVRKETKRTLSRNYYPASRQKTSRVKEKIIFVYKV